MCWAPRYDALSGAGRRVAAGEAALNIDDNLAQLAGSGTAPPFRGRGVQKALVQRRLHHARDAGCDFAVVVTAPGSRSQANVMRRGFALLYARAILVKTYCARRSPRRRRQEPHAHRGRHWHRIARRLQQSGRLIDGEDQQRAGALIRGEQITAGRVDGEVARRAATSLPCLHERQRALRRVDPEQRNAVVPPVRAVDELPDGCTAISAPLFEPLKEAGSADTVCRSVSAPAFAS